MQDLHIILKDSWVPLLAPVLNIYHRAQQPAVYAELICHTQSLYNPCPVILSSCCPTSGHTLASFPFVPTLEKQPCSLVFQSPASPAYQISAG